MAQKNQPDVLEKIKDSVGQPDQYGRTSASLEEAINDSWDQLCDLMFDKDAIRQDIQNRIEVVNG